MGLSVQTIELLLLVAAIVSMLARRVRLPYTVVLVLAGILLALLPFGPDVVMTKDLIFTALLPPLVFEAAFYISWSELRKDLLLVIVLATLGVLLSAAVTAAGMRYLAAWPWSAALVFGVLIAATDPVSVIATFKEAGATGRLRLLVESESLFNDGTAAVLFVIALALTTGQAAVGSVALSFGWIIFGGIGIGLMVGAFALFLAGKTDDHLVEITFTTVAAYGSFLAAEHFHCSGVLAALCAGLLLGNVGFLGAIADTGRDAVGSFWEYIAFVANSLVFLLMGIRLAHMNFAPVLMASIVAVFVVLVGRALAVYVCCALFARSKSGVPAAYQHVLFWGGLRGALALALALGLPAGMPRREEITAVAFAVVAFSVIVQGLTIVPMVRRLERAPSFDTMDEHG